MQMQCDCGGQKKVSESLGLESGGCEPPYGGWKLNPSPLQGQRMLTPTELSFQPHSLWCSNNPVSASHGSDVGHPEKIIGVSHTGPSAPCYPLRLQED